MSRPASNIPFLLNFPELSPEAVRPGALQNVLFVDPGAQPTPATPYWRPEGLPLALDTAQAFLRESARFAREHGGRGQALAATAMTRDAFYAQTTFAIRSSLTQDREQKNVSNQAIRAQQLLLLAWQLEQQALEIRSMQQGIDAGIENLNRVLGVEDADDESALDGKVDHKPGASQGVFGGASLGASGEPGEYEALPWRLILEALLYFALPQTVLTTCNREVLEALDEVDLEPAQTELGEIAPSIKALEANGTARLVKLPGWRITGRTRCPADMPWLAPLRTLLLVDASISEAKAAKTP